MFRKMATINNAKPLLFFYVIMTLPANRSGQTSDEVSHGDNRTFFWKE
jgi:hypothetical protein